MSFKDLPLLYETIGDLEIFRYVAVVAGLNAIFPEYLFKIRHRRTVLCDEKTGFAYLLCISVRGLVSCSQI